MQRIMILSSSAELDSHREFFAVGTRVCELPYAIFRQPERPQQSEQDLYRVGELGMKIASELMGIEGVEHIFMRSESVKVTKALTSSWRELQPRVLKVFESHLGPIETAPDYGSLTRTAAMEASA